MEINRLYEYGVDDRMIIKMYCDGNTNSRYSELDGVRFLVLDRSCGGGGYFYWDVLS